VQFLFRSLVVDSTRLDATGFEPARTDHRAGILKTLDEYEGSGWWPFRNSPHRPGTVEDDSPPWMMAET
jgi:hypothetical protein